MARTTTRETLLGLLALRPSWSSWELTKQLRRNLTFFWPRAESRVLAELKRLDRDGLANARTEANGRRERTVYSITPAGRSHLSAWLSTEPGGSILESEPLLRILLGELGGLEDIERAVARIEEDAHQILAVGKVVSDEYVAGTAPFQDHVHLRSFIYDYLTQHATGMLDWADRTRSALAEWPALDEEARTERALARIAARAAELPSPNEPAA